MGSPTHLSPGDLQRVMTGAWPPVETSRLGDWLLRAGHGFTGRANSALAVGDPGVPLGAALAEVERWYAARGLPPTLVVAGPAGFSPLQDPAGAAALARGWRDRVVTLTLVADTAQVASEATPEGLRLEDSMSDDWFSALTRYRSAERAAVAAVVHGSPTQRFATVRDQGQVIGIGRLGVSGGWGGIGAMWVDPAYRRRGIAAGMVGRLARAAAGLGAQWLHLQTDSDNAGALAVYEGLGFRPHHAYVYVTRPT